MPVEYKKTHSEYYDFHIGNSCRSYELFGCHESGENYVFRVWAPNADKVFLVGDFNGWADTHEMVKITKGGVFEASVDRNLISVGSKYKYKILSEGRILYKSDPYGTKMECPPNAATVIVPENKFEWHDKGWLSHRKSLTRAGIQNYPMNVYEVHLGSWKRRSDKSFYSYSELALDLAPYLKQMGYTHIELMPITEHPLDASLGYQTSGYYAPTSRFGEPQGFMEFVDIMHTAGIGVILDWVPAYFASDEYGLFEFDGKSLYEYSGYGRKESPHGGKMFDLGREEVISFLVSNAVYWADKYHIDGIRVNATSSMLYRELDEEYDRWLPNILRDNRRYEAVRFFRQLNSAMKREYPDVLMISDEHTSWQNLTSFEGDGALGFDMRWNTEWVSDTMSYVDKDPIFRKYHHENLTYSLCYASADKYILPLSHGEFIHNRKPLIEKSHGDYWNKFATTRALMGYMMTHPGKKHTFMGCEIASFSEWSHTLGIDFSALECDMHAKFQLYISSLNNFYLAHPELWQCDYGSCGFEWIDANDRERSIISFKRMDAGGKALYVIINFTPVPYEDYHLRLDSDGIYEEIFNSDDKKYGGSGVVNTGVKFSSEKSDDEEHPYRIRMRLPPMAISVVRCTRKSKKSTRPNFN